MVGFSGGLDSIVLLHVLQAIRKKIAFQLQAHHVHHGLSINADDWVNFCQITCNQLDISLTVSKVVIHKNTGLGIEASARKARYQALHSYDADFIVLAHHQNDQAETLLLQLARGAGVKGLAGMAAVDVTKKLLRPFLNVPRIKLEAYAKRHQLAWIEDESNADTQFDRNFLRHAVLPVFIKRYPAITKTLSRTAQHLAQANQLLNDLAQLDADHSLFNVHELGRLNLAFLKSLNLPRINNLVRWWLIQNKLALPSTAQLMQITQQLLTAKVDAAIKIKLATEYDGITGITLRRFQDVAYIVQNTPLGEPLDLYWQGEESIILPDQSQLVFSKKIGEGLSLAKLAKAELHIKSRAGGERLQPELGQPSRSLKVILQAYGVPPWLREQLPLIFIGQKLVIVPNIGLDAHLKANADEIGLVVIWQQSNALANLNSNII